jgi:hypothetical protein
MRLLILQHEKADLGRRDHHYIHSFCEVWRSRGVEIIHRAGWRNLPAADLVILHVDTSVVPEGFERALGEYPRVWNRRCTDIRKRSLPERGLVIAGPEEYDGPVIVKTDFNSAAVPELRLFRRRGWWANPAEQWRLWRNSRKASEQRDYAVYAEPGEVPAGCGEIPPRWWRNFCPSGKGTTMWCGGRIFWERGRRLSGRFRGLRSCAGRRARRRS